MASQQNIAGTTSGDNVKLDNVVIDAYSNEILFTAQPILRFEQIAQKRTELNVMPGNTIKFLKYSALSGSANLVETTPIETKSLSTSIITISVAERGFAVAHSEFLLRSSFTQVMQDTALLLGKHYAKSRDALIRDALMAGTNVLYADSTGAMTNTSRADLTNTDVFDVNLTREIVEFLATNKAPKFDMDSYIAFVHPHQAKSLRKDGAWVTAQLYTTPENIKSGEIGRIEDVRFIETTMVPYIPINTQDIWADNEDTTANTAIAANANTAVYRSVTVGDYAIGMAESLPVELRDNGVEDFGRKHSLAYYGIWGVGILETGHSVIGETA